VLTTANIDAQTKQLANNEIARVLLAAAAATSAGLLPATLEDSALIDPTPRCLGVLALLLQDTCAQAEANWSAGKEDSETSKRLYSVASLMRLNVEAAAFRRVSTADVAGHGVLEAARRAHDLIAQPECAGQLGEEEWEPMMAELRLLLLAAVAAEDRSGALFFELEAAAANDEHGEQEAAAPSAELVRCASLAQVRDERGASYLMCNNTDDDKAKDKDKVAVLVAAALRPGDVGAEARRVCSLYQCALLAGYLKGSAGNALAAAMHYTEQLMVGATRAIIAAQEEDGDCELASTVGALLPTWLSAAFARRILHPAAVPLLQALDDLKRSRKVGETTLVAYRQQRREQLALSKTLESPHPYANSYDDTQTVRFPTKMRCVITFDAQCATEEGCDVLKIKNGRGAELAAISGRRGSSNWATITVPEATELKFVFHSDGSNTDWGWKATVVAEGVQETRSSYVSELGWLPDAAKTCLCYVVSIYGGHCHVSLPQRSSG